MFNAVAVLVSGTPGLRHWLVSEQMPQMMIYENQFLTSLDRHDEPGFLKRAQMWGHTDANKRVEI